MVVYDLYLEHRFSPCLDIVVNLEEQADGLCSQLDGASSDEEGLDDLLLEDVGDETLADVDAGASVAQCMTVAQFSDDSDGVETSVLGKGGRDDLESIGVGLEAVRLHSLEGLCVLREEARDVDFRGTSTTDQGTGSSS